MRQLAAKHGLNLTQLADRSGIDRPALTNIARDNIGLGPRRAARIADALGEPVSAVLLPKAEAATLTTLANHLARLEAKVDESIALTNEALTLLHATRRRSRAAPRSGQDVPA